MNLRRTAAGLLGLVDSLAGVFLAYTTPFDSLYAALTGYLFWLSVILFLVSLACLYGIHYAYPVAAALSVIVALDGYFATDYPVSVVWGFVALSVVAAIANLVAYRSAPELSEQANPMNLPVFG
jgi:hypothetical protein